MKFFFPTLCALALLSGPALAGPNIPTTVPEGHEPIKAKVENTDPAHYTINVRQLANTNADEEAETFALYTRQRLPQTCGDFSNTKITYQKPAKYKRIFNLTDKPEILAAIKQYGCVVIPNVPAEG